MEPILPIEKPKSYDCYHDVLTQHYSAQVFYDALKREISFAKREGNLVGILKLELFSNATEDQMLYFANEIELAVRHHDLISRLASHEFVVLLRFDSEISAACEYVVQRLTKVEKRGFKFGWVITDGTKGLEQVLEELNNPQILRSSKTL
jgi:GGDEF domain-containing protein